MKKLLLILAFFTFAFTSSALAMDKLIIKDAWLRVAPNKVAGGFFEISNQTDKVINIISASAQGAGAIELHSHAMTDGIMKMRKEDLIEIPANSGTSFNPHSFHLMMFRLDKEIFKIGNMPEIILSFDDGTTMNTKFQVLKFGTELKPSMDHSKMDHSKMTMPVKN